MRKLEYYGFDNDTTMYKTENPPMDTISIVKEIKNEKHIDDEDETCEESSIYEIVGTPSYPSEIEGAVTSFDITFNYTKTDTDSACTETVTEGSDTVTVDCGSNPSTTDSRTVSGTVIWNDIEIEYSVTQAKYDPYNGYEYVEIGGKKWATMNVGASGVTDYGLYFQWGDAQGYTVSQVGSASGKKYFYWNDYKYGNGTSSPSATGMTKYNSTDGRTVLDMEDDAARVNMGGTWRMPTKEECQALRDAVKRVWTDNYEGSGVAGVICTTKDGSGAQLFFPANGDIKEGRAYYRGSVFNLWSSSLSSDNILCGHNMSVMSNGTIYWPSYNNRYFGYGVRGVAD